ncbi:MAG: hypothetical protein AABN95_20660 [Acidobacteriota bacterium]
MAYLTQIIVYVLAVMGILFKSTKTDSDGKEIVAYVVADSHHR